MHIFRMCFDDFVREFERLEFCLLGPDSISSSDSLYKKIWEGALLEGGWKKRVNAGGCRNYPGRWQPCDTRDMTK